MDKRPFKEIVKGTSIVIGTATRPLADRERPEANWTEAQKAKHTRILHENFNMLVCENASKPDALYERHWDRKSPMRIHPEAERVMKEAKDIAKFKTHTLAWHEQAPTFMQEYTRPPPPRELVLHVSDPDRQAIIREQVRVAASLYGKAGSYKFDVLNEAIDFRKDIQPNRFAVRKYWDDIGGEDFLGSLFVIAREQVPPGVILCYNDFGITAHKKDEQDKADAVFQMCKRMKDKGVPLDEVGFQCHEHAEEMIAEGWFERVKENMERFRSIGLRVNFSEVDIECSNTKLGHDPQVRLRTSANLWGQLVKTALSNPDICNEFTVWGFDTATSWLLGDKDEWGNLDARKVLANPCCPFLNGEETPIVQEIRKALAEVAPLHSQVGKPSGWEPFGCNLVFNQLTYNRTETWAGPLCVLPPATTVSFATYVISPSNVTVTLKEGEDGVPKNLTTNANGYIPLDITGLDASKRNVLYVEKPDKATDFCVVTKSYANGKRVDFEGFGCGLRPVLSTHGRTDTYAGIQLRVNGGRRCTLRTTVYTREPLKLTMKWSNNPNNYPLENFRTIKEKVSGRLEVSFESEHANNVYVFLEGPPTWVDFAVDSFTLAYQD